MMKIVHQRALYVMAAALPAALWLAGCSPAGKGPGGAKKMLPVAVRTAVARPGKIAERLQFTGELESPLSVQVSAKLSGRLDKLELTNGTEVTEGVEVRRNELIAEIEHRDLEAQLALADAQVRQAEAALNDKERERRRLEALFSQEVATEQARDAAVAAHESAEAALAQARAQHALARVNLEESFIRAPMDGVVAERYVDPGAMVGANAPIVRLVQMTPLRLMVSVPARMLPLPSGETPVEVGTDIPTVFSLARSADFPTVDTSTARPGGNPFLNNERNSSSAEAIAARHVRHGRNPPGGARERAAGRASVLRVLERQVIFVVEDGVARARTVVSGITAATG